MFLKRPQKSSVKKISTFLEKKNLEMFSRPQSPKTSSRKNDSEASTGALSRALFAQMTADRATDLHTVDLSSSTNRTVNSSIFQGSRSHSTTVVIVPENNQGQVQHSITVNPITT